MKEGRGVEAAVPAASVARHGVFETLDGVRGVAAVAVVIFHAPIFFTPFALNGAYLAVDLFFALSGFVIDFAYRARLDAGLGVRGFMRLRLVRLYPLYILGAVIGAASGLAALLLGGGELSAGGLAVAAATSVAILPSPTWGQAPQLFPLNSPAWSLFFELAVNLVYVLLWPRLTLRTAAGVAAMAGLVLAGLTLAHGGLGLGDTWGSAGFGFLRALTSFFAGVTLHRLFAARGGRPSSVGVAVLLPLALPLLFAVNPGGWRAIYELAFIGLVTPALLWLCAHAAPGPRLGRLYAFLGAVSYAVYVLHYPLIELIRRALRIFGEQPETFAPWLGVMVLIALLLGAWLADRIYDLPVRRRLAAFSARLLEPAPAAGREPLR